MTRRSAIQTFADEATGDDVPSLSVKPWRVSEPWLAGHAWSVVCGVRGLEPPERPAGRVGQDRAGAGAEPIYRGFGGGRSPARQARNPLNQASGLTVLFPAKCSTRP